MDMLIRIDAADPRAIYMQIVDEVRRGIVLGSITPDAPMPSVRQLAAELRVNPNTVQQAYRELERRGVVYVRRGQGTFISPHIRDDEKEERAALARTVAKRASTDAYRHGLSTGDLISALRELEDDNEGETT